MVPKALYIFLIYACVRSRKPKFSETLKYGDSKEKKSYANILRRRHSSGNLVNHKKNEIFEIFENFREFREFREFRRFWSKFSKVSKI